jgi:hypothetical protein
MEKRGVQKNRVEDYCWLLVDWRRNLLAACCFALRAHAQYHMIQQLKTDIDITETELLYAPIWFAQYDHKGKKIILVIDGNSGGVINSIGL